MPDVHPFQRAVEARDLGAIAETLAPNVVFYTPLRFQPFEGRDQALVAMTLAANAFAFQDGFRYVDELRRDDRLALFFEARLGNRFLEGVDDLRLDADGLVSQLRVLMRPFSAVRDLVAVTAAALGGDDVRATDARPR